MRLVHLSDIHLGFRQYQRLTPAGINQREADVAQTFRRAIDQVIALRPGLVLIGGDVFHNVRPTNSAILHAFQQFSRLVSSLPEAEIVMIAGNHDTPRALETGCILRLFIPLGIHVVDDAPRRLQFGDRDLSILAVPYTTASLPALTPDPDARFNVLLMHCEVEGVLPAHLTDLDRAAIPVSPAALGARRWSYVALGHYHVHREIAANAWYSGSLDYTSPNVWSELTEERATGLPGKGFIEFDLERGKHRFHHVEATRELIDLPLISARGKTVAELDAAIKEACEGCPGGIDDRVVRLVVRDVPRHIVRDLDHRTLREFKRRALHFNLDTRRPELIRTQVQGAPGRRPGITEIVLEKLRTRPLDANVEREALVTLGLHYLREVETLEQSTAVPVEPD